MRISVITPTLRAGADLDMAVASVREQTHDDVEHIIVSAEPGVQVEGARVIHTPPRGVYDALNRGFAAATGEVVGLLHAGDTFASADVLARVAGAFDDPALDYIWGDIQYVSGADRRPGRRYSGSAGLSTTLLTRGLQPPHPSLFMRPRLSRPSGHTTRPSGYAPTSTCGCASPATPACAEPTRAYSPP
ncbi:MAG: glycosyltransferase [Bacteroides sp.]|nr:glycosyltransferase [Bacteroides sp.]